MNAMALPHFSAPSLFLPHGMTRRHGVTILSLAVLLHVGVFLWWALFYEAEPEIVEMHTLNFTLGSGGNIFVEPITPPAQEKDTDDSSRAMAFEPASPIQQVIEQHAPMIEQLSERAAAQQQQEVRDPMPETLPDPGDAVESSHQERASATPQSDAMVARAYERYSQLLSSWIETHKRYPAAAREQGAEGNGLVRLRIDRKGNVLFRRMEHGTGFEVLDRAILDMIDRSNPVPAVPGEIGGGKQLEFLVPISFIAE